MKKTKLLLLLLPFVVGCGKHIVNSVYYDESYVDKDISFVQIDSTLSSNRSIDSFILMYKTTLEQSMNQVVGYTLRPLTKAQPECTLGYLAVDALYDFAFQKDTLVVGAVMNYGGLRINYLSPGEITIGNVFEIMPFDNQVVVIEVPGTIIKQWCDHMAERGGWPIVGIRYEIKDKKAVNITIQNKSINDHIVYKIATTDYVANGGDNCEFLKGLKRITYNKFHRDTMMDFLSKKTMQKDTLNYSLENRVVIHE